MSAVHDFLILIHNSRGQGLDESERLVAKLQDYMNRQAYLSEVDFTDAQLNQIIDYLLRTGGGDSQSSHEEARRFLSEIAARRRPPGDIVLL